MHQEMAQACLLSRIVTGTHLLAMASLTTHTCILEQSFLITSDCLTNSSCLLRSFARGSSNQLWRQLPHLRLVPLPQLQQPHKRDILRWPIRLLIASPQLPPPSATKLFSTSAKNNTTATGRATAIPVQKPFTAGRL